MCWSSVALEHRAAVLEVIGRQVGAAAEEADADGGAGD